MLLFIAGRPDEKFFDSVRWDLIVKAVEAHTDLPWVLLHVRLARGGNVPGTLGR